MQAEKSVPASPEVESVVMRPSPSEHRALVLPESDVDAGAAELLAHWDV